MYIFNRIDSSIISCLLCITHLVIQALSTRSTHDVESTLPNRRFLTAAHTLATTPTGLRTMIRISCKIGEGRCDLRVKLTGLPNMDVGIREGCRSSQSPPVPDLPTL